MQNQNIQTKRASTAGIYIFITWITYVLLLITLKNNETLRIYRGIVPIFVESSLYAIIAVYAFWLWRRATADFKRIFGFFALSFSCVVIASGIYHLAFNVLSLKVSYFNLNNLYVLTHHIPYLICLIFEFLAWISILSLIKEKTRNFTVYLPILLLIAIIIIIFSFSLQWKLTEWTNSKNWLTEITITAFHLVLFISATIGLVLSKNKGLFYLAAGYLLICGADLILDFGAFSQSPGMGSLFESCWLFGGIFVLYALINFKKTVAYKASPRTWISSLDSIKAQCALWSFVLCSAALAILLVIGYITIPKGIIFSNNIVRVLPPILIAASVFFVVISHWFAKKLTRPIQNIENLITSFREDKALLPTAKDGYKIQELRYIEEYLAKSFKFFKQKREAEKALFNAAVQVAHDIRSPLAALQVVLTLVTDTKEEYRIIIRNATNRINDIANNLLTKYRNPNVIQQNTLQEKQSDELIVSILDNISSEKRAQYKNKNINFELEVTKEARSLFAKINAENFKRILSNLIDNACEAIKYGQGIVTLSLTKRENNLILTIKDNGIGIPEEVLTKLGKEKIVFGKKTGYGLGIFTAIQQIKEWSGDCQIQSEVDKGTTCIIKLPITCVPLWFQESVNLAADTKVVILDDDESIHNIWDTRFKDYMQYGISLVHFHKAQELLDYQQNLQSIPQSTQKQYYLLDYELLGSDETGLDLLKKLNFNLEGKATLVTSHYENPQIRKECIKLGVRIIPKNFAPYVSLVI